jgi:hypothetical protein
MHDKFVPRRFGWYALKRIPVRRLGSAGIAMMVVAPAVAGSAAMFGTNPVLAAGQTAVRPTLTASDGAAGDGFANSLAISGSIAVVGASGKNSLTGAAYVFTRTGSTWSQQAELTASDGVAGDYFGYSVATSGSTVVVGAYGKNSGAGAAYVFGRSGTTWTQQAELTAADGGAPDFFGVSVAVSGSTAVVGAYNKNSHVGAAEVFVGSGTTWTHQAELTASDGVSPDFFGFSVAISGSTAVVGAYGKNSGAGASYAFVRSGTTWSQQAELTASDGAAQDGFGRAVAISGSTAVIGAAGKNSGVGVAYAFVRSGTTWSQQAELIGSDSTFANFGASVAISGSTAVVGAPLPFLPRHRGGAYVFVQSGTTWTQLKILSASDGTLHQGFGSPVAISGSTALVGHFSRTSMIGSVYIFHV